MLFPTRLADCPLTAMTIQYRAITFQAFRAEGIVHRFRSSLVFLLLFSERSIIHDVLIVARLQSSELRVCLVSRRPADKGSVRSWDDRRKWTPLCAFPAAVLLGSTSTLLHVSYPSLCVPVLYIALPFDTSPPHLYYTAYSGLFYTGHDDYEDE